MKNIVVLVSGGGTNLQALIDAQKSDLIKGGQITCVISDKEDAYALTRAKDNDIDTAVILRKDYETLDKFDNALTSLLLEKKADLIVLAGFLTILGDKVVNIFENKIINVHPSLIPAFCGEGFYGLKVHQKALEKGVKVTGATVHFVTEVCDGGPIILQKAVEVKDDDTPEILQKRVMEECEWKILPEAVSLICMDRIKIVNNKTKIVEGGNSVEVTMHRKLSEGKQLPRQGRAFGKNQKRRKSSAGVLYNGQKRKQPKQSVFGRGKRY